MKVLFFGKLSSDLGLREVDYVTDQSPISIDDVVDGLALQYGEVIRDALNAVGIVAAVEQKTQLDRQFEYAQIHEIAFFPPVTGG